jgi:hypothetical protein
MPAPLARCAFASRLDGTPMVILRDGSMAENTIRDASSTYGASAAADQK